jgi:CheY-like chemotaxis protein
MPKPSRRRIPDEQLDQLRSSHQAQLDALAERACCAQQLATVEATRGEVLARLDAEVAGARHDLLLADLRLAEMIGVEATATMTGTSLPELRRAVKETGR